MCNQYQGYSNYPTWAVSLWLNNDANNYSHWVDRAQDLANESGKEDAVSDLASELENEVTEFAPEVEGMYSDIFTWAMDQVDWQEIAESMLEDIEVESDDEELEAEEE